MLDMANNSANICLVKRKKVIKNKINTFGI